MSKITKKIYNIKKMLDSISGLDGPFVELRITYIEKLVNKTIIEIDQHEKEDPINGTIWEE